MVSTFNDGINSMTIVAADESERLVFRSECGQVVTGRTLKEAIVSAGRHPGVKFRDKDGREIRHNYGDGGYVTNSAGQKRYW